MHSLELVLEQRVLCLCGRELPFNPSAFGALEQIVFGDRVAHAEEIGVVVDHF